MLIPRNLRLLYKYFILRYVPASSQTGSQSQAIGSTRARLNNSRLSSNMLISVDGNISSGKSTLVSKLVEHLSKLNTCQNGQHDSKKPENGELANGHGHGHGLASFELEVIPEPLEKWCDMKGFNLLELFYQEPKKYNFLFQHYVQLTRLMDTIKSSESNSHMPKIRIMERSLQNNRYCFLELARKCEQLQSAEFAVLAEWHSWLETNMDLHLDLVIYLRTAPEVAYQRMTNRARAEESTCPLSYLAALHESYEDWLIRDKVGPEKRRRQQVIVVDANQSREDVAADCIQQLTRFLSSHSKSANGVHEASPIACADICRE